MYKRISCIYLFLTFALVGLIVYQAGIGRALAKSDYATEFEEIDTYVLNAMNRSGSPGLAYAVVHNEEIVHMKAYGSAGPDGVLVTTSTPFIIGSVGKTFTALAIRQLINSDQIDPNEPVQSYISWFTVSDPQAANAITIQNLLDHKSGIPTSAGNQFYQLDERYDLEDIVRKSSTIKLSSVPGTKFEYSNVNFLILGLIIEKVSGTTYEDYVQQHILMPLGMDNTYLDEEEAQMNGLAKGYQSWYGMFIPIHASFPRGMQPSGFVISNVEDLGKYLIAYLNQGFYQGSSIVDPDQEITTNKYYGYDIYWNEQRLDPNIMEGQSGGTLNFNADIQIIPESRWGVVVLMNSRWTLDGMLPTVTAASIANGVACRIKSWPTLDEAPLSYTQWYLILDLILLMVITFGVYRLVSFSSWRKRVSRGANISIHRQALSIGLDVIVALILIGLPILKNYSLVYFIYVLPDIAIVLISVSVVLLIIALLKVIFLINNQRNSKKELTV